MGIRTNYGQHVSGQAIITNISQLRTLLITYHTAYLKRLYSYCFPSPLPDSRENVAKVVGTEEWKASSWIS
jgi:hypothetical protein